MWSPTAIYFSCFLLTLTETIELGKETETERSQVRSILNRLRQKEEAKHPSSPYNKIRSLIKQSFDVNGQTEDLFEGDIILSLPQARKIAENLDKESPPRKKRQVVVGETLKWNKVIPYEMVDEEARGLAEDSMAVITAQTCLVFKERTTEEDYIRFVHAAGCFSAVGKVGGGQPVSMGYGCSLGAAVHEVLHALGLWHEQARSDRDRFVKIRYENIQLNRKDNFIKRGSNESENNEERYDYGSIMHYGPNTFGIESADTLETVDPRFQHTIGQRADVSFKDMKLINMRYCSDSCPTKLDCQYGGYTDPQECSKCKCPNGIGGTLCNEVKTSDFQACGDTDLDASDSHVKTIVISNIRGPGRCNYRIKAQPGFHVKLEVVEQSFECVETCSSYLEAKHLKDKTTTGFRMCCDEALDYNIVSQDHEMIVVVHHEKEDRDFTTKMIYYQVNEHRPIEGVQN